MNSIREMQQARYAIERKALAEAAKDPTFVGLIGREYAEARAQAVHGRADPYLTGRADALEDIKEKLNKSLTNS